MFAFEDKANQAKSEQVSVSLKKNVFASDLERN